MLPRPLRGTACTSSPGQSRNKGANAGVVSRLKPAPGVASQSLRISAVAITTSPKAPSLMMS